MTRKLKPKQLRLLKRIKAKPGLLLTIEERAIALELKAMGLVFDRPDALVNQQGWYPMGHKP